MLLDDEFFCFFCFDGVFIFLVFYGLEIIDDEVAEEDIFFI